MPTRQKPKTVAGYRHGRVPRAERTLQLLNVAENLFAERGYQGTTLEDIAQAAGVTRPIVYAHFGTRDDVYLACVKRARSQFEDQLTQAVTAAPEPIAKLAAGSRVYFEYVQAHPDAWNVLFGSGAAIAGNAAEECLRLRFATVDHIAKLLALVAPQVDKIRIEAYAHAVTGSGNQLATWWTRNPQITLDEIIARHMEFSWRGLEQLAEAAQRNGPTPPKPQAPPITKPRASKPKAA
jgi:AcrR family transcriptional regulator